jgi:uncharacterized membrane protein YkoI
MKTKTILTVGSVLLFVFLLEAGVLLAVSISKNKNPLEILFPVSKEDALKIAQTNFQGTLNEIELENGFYEVDFLDNGIETEVRIDATSGDILSIEEEEEDVPITGTALERASAAALAYIGQGRVTDSEVGDEDGYYEIEITKNNGREVDVHLDRNFNILSVEED